MKKYYIILCLTLIYSCACPSIIKEYNSNCEKANIVRTNLKIDKAKYRTIKNKDSIINSLYESIKDTVKVSLINRRLDSFLLKSYTKKEFLGILKMDKAFKCKNTAIEINRKLDLTKTQNFETAEDYSKHHKQVMKSLKANTEFKPNAIKDSIVIKKDSLN